MRVVSLLGEIRPFFFNFLVTAKISKSFKLSVYINVVLLINFHFCQSFLSECVFLSITVFDLSLPVGDKFPSQMISGTVSRLLGLDRIFK